MNIILHRRNTIEQLLATPENYGVEVDIRSQGSRLIIHHEPFTKGEFFDEWIDNYRHKTLILNVKEEGLEERLISIMQSRSIEDYFFLDQSFPFLVKFSGVGVHRCAVRISEYETVETALSLASKVDWVWVDCFTRFPIGTADAKRLKDAGFKLCLVSPELQGRSPDTEIHALITLLAELRITADAVCTKCPDLWETAS